MTVDCSCARTTQTSYAIPSEGIATGAERPRLKRGTRRTSRRDPSTALRMTTLGRFQSDTANETGENRENASERSVDLFRGQICCDSREFASIRGLDSLPCH